MLLKFIMLNLKIIKTKDLLCFSNTPTVPGRASTRHQPCPPNCTSRARSYTDYSPKRLSTGILRNTTRDLGTMPDQSASVVNQEHRDTSLSAACWHPSSRTLALSYGLVSFAGLRL